MSVLVVKSVVLVLISVSFGIWYLVHSNKRKWDEHFSKECSLPLIDPFQNTPFVFSSIGTFATTELINENAYGVKIRDGGLVIISCYPNYFSNPDLNATYIRAICKDKQTLVVKGVDRDWKRDLHCKQQQQPPHEPQKFSANYFNQILTPITGCNNSFATSLKFGYANPVENRSLILGEACYSKIEGRTIFIHTKHVGDNNFQQVAIKSENINYLTQPQPDEICKTNLSVALDYYKYGNVSHRNDKHRHIMNPKPDVIKHNFIKREHFPDGQLHELYNSMGWNFFLSFEHFPNFGLLLKDIMHLKEKNFDLFMGTHDILALKVNRNRFDLADIYLMPDEKKYPVPKYIWIVVTVGARKAAAFLIFNNIYATRDEIESAELCESKCTQLTWLKYLVRGNSYSNTRNGYVWCCELDSFKKNINEIPLLGDKYKFLI